MLYNFVHFTVTHRGSDLASMQLKLYPGISFEILGYRLVMIERYPSTTRPRPIPDLSLDQPIIIGSGSMRFED